MTAEEKQEDGGETRCHETKSNGNNVINTSIYMLIRRAETQTCKSSRLGRRKNYRGGFHKAL